ncbi:MAG: hypothetical protein WBH86_01860 [Thermogutta sp.]
MRNKETETASFIVNRQEQLGRQGCRCAVETPPALAQMLPRIALTKESQRYV